MGCQTDIVKCVKNQKADYMLSLTGNHGTLHEDVQQYFDDPKRLSGCAYHKAVDKAHGAVEIREYWQTSDIGWLEQKKA